MIAGHLGQYNGDELTLSQQEVSILEICLAHHEA